MPAPVKHPISRPSFGVLHPPIFSPDVLAPVKVEIPRTDEDCDARAYALLNFAVHRILRSGEPGSKRHVIAEWLEHPATLEASEKAIGLAKKMLAS
ncbi:MAG TPA: hypothetical protein VHZ55_10135 [Bryobacteraceae bacterium]|jgi:hypothetical protein|nr:hypothetical protein [Bryobacteraceae bacterium]